MVTIDIRMAPKSRITARLLDELVIEERVVVDKLEKGILLLLTDGSVLADEAALLQLFQKCSRAETKLDLGVSF